MHQWAPTRSRVGRRGGRIGGVVLVYEIALVLVAVLIVWFSVYVLYRLVTDDSTGRHYRR